MSCKHFTGAECAVWKGIKSWDFFFKVMYMGHLKEKVTESYTCIVQSEIT